MRIWRKRDIILTTVVLRHIAMWEGFMYDLSLGGYGASLTTSLRLILGITLIFAGLTKARDLPNFVIGVIYYKVLPENVARWYGRLLPFVEIGAGALLLFGIWTKLVSILSIGIFVSFSIAVSLNLARKRKIPCFCFGANSSEIGWYTLVRISPLVQAVHAGVRINLEV